MDTDKDFPVETVSEILKCLPPKDLGRFKTVSKPWSNLIQSKYFVNNIHLMEMKKQNQYLFLFQEEVGKWPLYYDETPTWGIVNKRVVGDGDHEIELLASCSGLVLFCNSQDVFFLGNPITTETIFLPNNHIVFPEESKWAHVFFGVAYDQTNEDYKVVRIAQFANDGRDTEVKIFSTKNKVWRRIPDVPFQYICLEPGVFVHGRLHWKVVCESKTYAIVSLDGLTETYDLIQLPVDFTTNFTYYDLGSVDDETLILYPHFCKVFDLYTFWIMKEYGSQWLKLRIPIGPQIAPNTNLFSLQPLCWVDTNHETILWRINPEGRFWPYNYKEDVMEFYPLLSVHVNAYITIFRIANSIGGP